MTQTSCLAEPTRQADRPPRGPHRRCVGHRVTLHPCTPPWVLAQTPYTGSGIAGASWTLNRFTMRLIFTTIPISTYGSGTRHWPRERARRPPWLHTISASLRSTHGCSLAGSASASARRDSIDIRCQLACLLNFVEHGEDGLGESDPLREVSRLRQER